MVNARNGAHWSQTSVETKALRLWFATQAKKHRAPEWPWPRVEVEFLLTRAEGQPLPDTDAIAGAAKAALDGVVDSGLIVDDTGHRVRSVTFHAPEVTGEEKLLMLIKRVAA